MSSCHSSSSDNTSSTFFALELAFRGAMRAMRSSVWPWLPVYKFYTLSSDSGVNSEYCFMMLCSWYFIRWCFRGMYSSNLWAMNSSSFLRRASARIGLFPPDVCTPWQTRAAPHWFALCPSEEFVDELPRLRRLESAALPEMQKALCTCLFLRHTIANHLRNLPLLLIPSWTTRFSVVSHTSSSLMSEILPHLPNKH